MSQVCKFIAENSDYEILVSPDGQLVTTRKDSGFEFLFKSAKTNFGIRKGSFMYEVKIIEFLETDNYYGPGHKAKQELAKSVFSEGQNPRHIVRVGFSHSTYQKVLGSDLNGCGIDNLGNKYYGGFKKQYFEGFEQGDVIRCCIELSGHQNIISYYKNGKFLGGCYEIPQNRKDKAWFPMVSLRNACVEFNFGGINNTEFYPIIEEKEDDAEKKDGEAENKEEEKDKNSLPKVPPQPVKKYNPETQALANFNIDIKTYKFFNQAIEDERDYFLPKDVQGAPKLILMVGLPSSGKTTFAEQYIMKYPNTILLSTSIIFNHIIEHFKITQVNFKIILLMELCDEIFIKLMKITALTYKDVIIDQCNIFLRARLEKLSYFKHHQNEAVVMITSNIEQEKRIQRKEKRQEKYLPKIGQNALKTMKENFVIPSESEGFYRVHYIEVDDQLAKKVILLGKELSELQIHPLLRKKQFREIDKFKEKHQITANFVDFEQIKRKMENEKNQLIKAKLAKEQEEKLKKLNEEKMQEEQQKQQNGETVTENKEKEQVETENKEQPETQQTQVENQQNGEEQKQENTVQNSEKTEVAGEKQNEVQKQQNIESLPLPPPNAAAVNQSADNVSQTSSNLKRQNPVPTEQSEFEVKGVLPPQLQQNKPQNKPVNHNNNHNHNKKQQRHNNNQPIFNRLDERKAQNFNYSNQNQQNIVPAQNQMGFPPQNQQYYPPNQPPMQHQPQPAPVYQQDNYYQQPQIQPQQPYYPPQQQYAPPQNQQYQPQQPGYYPPQQQYGPPQQQYNQQQYDPNQGYYQARR